MTHNISIVVEITQRFTNHVSLSREIIRSRKKQREIKIDWPSIVSTSIYIIILVIY